MAFIDDVEVSYATDIDIDGDLDDAMEEVSEKQKLIQNDTKEDEQVGGGSFLVFDACVVCFWQHRESLSGSTFLAGEARSNEQGTQNDTEGTKSC